MKHYKLLYNMSTIVAKGIEFGQLSTPTPITIKQNVDGATIGSGKYDDENFESILDINKNGSLTSHFTLNFANHSIVEKFKSDSTYEEGTLVKFGGTAEITSASDGAVNGVVSSSTSAIVLDCESEGLPVALFGKAQIKIVGAVNKFDPIYLSDQPGIGIANSGSGEPIARALETNSTEEAKNVLCITNFKL